MEEIPESVADLFDDANGELAIGELPSAIEKYRKCTEIEPAFFDGWHALGMALMKNGQYPEAIEAGNKAVELRPNDPETLDNLALGRGYVRSAMGTISWRREARAGQRLRLPLFSGRTLHGGSAS